MKADNIREFLQENKTADFNDPVFLEQLKTLSLPTNVHQELEMTHSLVQTHSDTSDSGDKIEQHNHGFFEILYCVQGRIEYLLGTKRYQIQPGDIIFVPPGVVHCPIFPDQMETPYVRHVLWISTNFLKGLQAAFPETVFHESVPKVLRTTGTHWEYLEQFFNRGIQESTVKATDWDICVYGNTIQLIAHLRRALYHNSGNHPSHQDTDLMEEVLIYIQQHLSEKITLSSTAKHFAVCESTISQLFRKQMGTSFYRCVTQRRLAEAKRLIGTGIPLEQVGIQTGFQDYSSFYRAFKAEFGLSPREFKKLDELRTNGAIQ